MQTAFSSNQVVELTGISLRQLQWLDERGIVVPTREGHRRLYSPEDIAEIAIISELRARGFSLQRVRAVICFLQSEFDRRLIEATSSNAEVHLLTDGRHIFLEDSERGVINVLKNSRQPLLAVCLSDAVQRVTAGVRGGSVQPTRFRAQRESADIALRGRDRKKLLRRVAGGE